MKVLELKKYNYVFHEYHYVNLNIKYKKKDRYGFCVLSSDDGVNRIYRWLFLLGAMFIDFYSLEEKENKKRRNLRSVRFDVGLLFKDYYDFLPNEYKDPRKEWLGFFHVLEESFLIQLRDHTLIELQEKMLRSFLTGIFEPDRRDIARLYEDYREIREEELLVSQFYFFFRI